MYLPGCGSLRFWGSSSSWDVDVKESLDCFGFEAAVCNSIFLLFFRFSEPDLGLYAAERDWNREVYINLSNT